jgi:hypothetical protein
MKMSQILIPENWKSKKPIKGWIHIATMGSGDLIAAELHGRLIQSGLYEASDIIYVTILGDIEKRNHLTNHIFNKYKKYNVHHYSENFQEYEWPSLLHIKKIVDLNEDFNCFYIHTKGASNCNYTIPEIIQKNIRCWRNLMCFYTIGQYKQCQYLLDSGYDTVGSLFKKNKPENYENYLDHYAGNFWWSTSNYIKQLPEITSEMLIIRNKAEYWICDKLNGKHFNQLHIETSDFYGFNNEDPFINYKENQ